MSSRKKIAVALVGSAVVLGAAGAVATIHPLSLWHSPTLPMQSAQGPETAGAPDLRGQGDTTWTN